MRSRPSGAAEAASSGVPRAAAAGPDGRGGSSLPREVVKVGGSLARDRAVLTRIMQVLAAADAAPLVVPGGGALADAVRALHVAGGLSEATAHRMALLSLDQVALWLVELAGGASEVGDLFGPTLRSRAREPRLVRSADEIAAASRAGALPVLAPAGWLEREEPLPACWDVTSDSIAAWIAGRIGARRLLLLKSFRFARPEVRPNDLQGEVDGWFLRALPADIACTFLDGRDPEEVAAALAGVEQAGTTLVSRSGTSTAAASSARRVASQIPEKRAGEGRIPLREVPGVPLVTVDAFTEDRFRGNPAAVCLLTEPRDESWMQAVAREMNLSETAFVLERRDGFELRWFTPRVEVDLCGHATLASAHVLWQEGRLPPEEPARFHTRSGLLTAVRSGEWIELDFPTQPPEPCPAPPGLEQALGAVATHVARSRYDLLLELGSERAIRELAPDFRLLAELPVRGVIVTSRADSHGYDFVSRFFAPQVGIDEDPVTGSAHCTLGPYWGERLHKRDLFAYQASPRGGVIRVGLGADRVTLGGKAVSVLRGTLL